MRYLYKHTSQIASMFLNKIIDKYELKLTDKNQLESKINEIEYQIKMSNLYII